MNKIKNIRQEMTRRGIDVWMARVIDVHNSEYICEHDNVLKWATGFTGESAALVITDSEARLWVDGRFFISAEREIDGSEIILMKSGLPDVPSRETWLKDYKEQFCRTHAGRECVISQDPELVAGLWTDRPGRPADPIYIHAGQGGFDENGRSEYEDRSAAEKLKLIRDLLRERKSEAVFVRSLDNVSWITNLRGSDIECTPVFFAFMYISMDNAVIFLQKKAITEKAAGYLKMSGISVTDYEHFADFEKDCGEVKLASEDIVTGLKAIKTEKEIGHIRECHIRDGVYVTRFIRAVKQAFANGTDEQGASVFEDEISCGDYLDRLRAQDDRYISPSFPTISAYGENAAIVHYRADRKSSRKLEKKGLYLVDSGGQYMDGTTDITRTIALGELTDEEKLHYTLVMCGMLRLMNAVFDEGTDSLSLDSICRKPLYDHGLDFRHGTGHGVGYCGCVHEDPVRISNSPRCAELIMRPGMVTSDEPGVYIEGSHGVRIENMLVCERTGDGEEACAGEMAAGRLHFTCLTWAPLDPAAVDIRYMSGEDIAMYNEYQSRVYGMIAPYLTEDEAEWLKNETAPLTKY